MHQRWNELACVGRNNHDADTDRHHLSRGSLIQVMPQIRQSDGGGVRQVVGPEVPEVV